MLCNFSLPLTHSGIKFLSLDRGRTNPKKQASFLDLCVNGQFCLGVGGHEIADGFMGCCWLRSRNCNKDNNSSSSNVNSTTASGLERNQSEEISSPRVAEAAEALANRASSSWPQKERALQCTSSRGGPLSSWMELLSLSLFECTQMTLDFLA